MLDTYTQLYFYDREDALQIEMTVFRGFAT